jgi:hypothetical protein
MSARAQNENGAILRDRSRAQGRRASRAKPPVIVNGRNGISRSTLDEAA